MPDLAKESSNHQELTDEDKVIDDDSGYDDLHDVAFPIVDPKYDENSEDQTPPNEFHVPNTETSTMVDENAVLRCFDLSINAHIRGVGDVPEFQPLSAEELMQSQSSKDDDDFDVSKDSDFTKENHTIKNCEEEKHNNQDAGKNAVQESEKGTANKEHSFEEKAGEGVQEPREWSPGSLPLPPWALPP
mmetsp:Transcript_8609/g.18387  ORF Transcript_8609/g.18387 Transcript_8609/m.18387 type:complete len:188 (-) Transcript_8609:85-648(-)